jgi:hypothetical protein
MSDKTIFLPTYSGNAARGNPSFFPYRRFAAENPCRNELSEKRRTCAYIDGGLHQG